MKKVILGALLFAPALTFAQATTTLPQVNASCVQNALVKKQQANQTAEATYNTAFNTAVANQITKINSATTTDLRSERDLLRNIWKQFRTDVKTAKETMQSSKKVNQTTFQTDLKACGVGNNLLVDENDNFEKRLKSMFSDRFGRNFMHR
jgi:hypothetical protein